MATTKGSRRSGTSVRRVGLRFAGTARPSEGGFVFMTGWWAPLRSVSRRAFEQGCSVKCCVRSKEAERPVQENPWRKLTGYPSKHIVMLRGKVERSLSI